MSKEKFAFDKTNFILLAVAMASTFATSDFNLL